MANEIKYSPNLDIDAKTIIIDNAPEGIVKFYPYIFTNYSHKAVLIQPNTVSIVSVSQLPILGEEHEYFNYKLDENGNAYIEAFGLMTESGVVNIDPSTSLNGSTLSNQTAIDAITNDLVVQEIIPPFLVTIGRPLVISEYETGKQEVFMVTDFQSALNYTTLSELKGKLPLSDVSTTVMSLVNMDSIVQSEQNARVVLDDYAVKQPDGSWATISSNPKVQVGSNSVTGFQIGVEKNALIGRTLARGTINGVTKQIPLVSSTALIPTKQTTIDVTDKTTNYTDWLDYDQVIPMVIAKEFAKSADGITLSTLATVNIAPNTKYISQDEKNWIEDMFLISYLYATNFADMPRFTEADINKMTNAAGQKPGDLKADVTVGHEAMSISVLENKDPIKVIDSIFDKHMRTAGRMDDPNRKSLRQMICALSKFIYSSYAIGGGNNSFNAIWLPWYLDVSPKVSLSTTKVDPNAKNVTLSTFFAGGEIQFVLRSEWFDIEFAATPIIKPKGNINLSHTRMIQTDRKLTVPTPSDYITARTKLPLPGNVSLTTSDDLNYNWYIPSASIDLTKYIYMNEVQSTTKVTNEGIFSTEGTDWGDILDGPNAERNFILQQASKKFKIPVSEITIISNGNKVTEYSTTNKSLDSYRPGSSKSTWSQSPEFGASGARSLKDQKTIQGWTSRTIYNPMIVKGLLENGVPRDGAVRYYPIGTYFQNALKNVYNSGSKGVQIQSKPTTGFVFANWDSLSLDVNGTTDTNGYGNDRLEFKEIRVSYNDVKVQFANPITLNEITYNRDTIYDKEQWRELITAGMTTVKDEANTHFFPIVFTASNNATIERLIEIDLTGLWTDVIKVTVNGIEKQLNMFCQFDESIAIQRIIFA